MTKLEELCNGIDEKRAQSLPQRSILTRAQDSLRNKRSSVSMDLEHISDEFYKKVGLLTSQLDQISTAQEILCGQNGYFRCPQDQKDVISGFTAVEEVAHLAGNLFITFSFDVLVPGLGEVVYSIAKNGLLTKIDQKVDSSD